MDSFSLEHCILLVIKIETECRLAVVNYLYKLAPKQDPSTDTTLYVGSHKNTWASQLQFRASLSRTIHCQQFPKVSNGTLATAAMAPDDDASRAATLAFSAEPFVNSFDILAKRRGNGCSTMRTVFAILL